MRFRELQEGTKLTRTLIDQALADSRITMGFEAEMLVQGISSMITDTVLGDAIPTHTGELVKPLASLTFPDFLQFFGPIGLKGNRRIHLLNRLAFLRGQYGLRGDDHVIFDELLQREGPVGLLVLTQSFPTTGFAVSDKRNRELVQAIHSQQEPDLAGLNYRLFQEDKPGDFRAITLNNRGVKGFRMERDPNSLGHFLAEIGKQFSTSLDVDIITSIDPLDNPETTKGYRNWLLTVDDTIGSDDRESIGVELISPKMGFADGMATLERVLHMMTNFQGRDQNLHIHTDQTTGLHINLGLQGVSTRHIDWLKIVFLLGEEHLLDMFRRGNNRMTASILKKLKLGLRIDPREIATMIPNLREIAWKVLTADDYSGKYYTVNATKLTQGYLEFRIIGNHNYHVSFEKLKPAIFRFAVLLEAAADPTMFQREYLKKLYQFFTAPEIVQPQKVAQA